MPLEARAELRAEEGRGRSIQEARGKVIDGARAEPRASEYSIIVPDGGVAMVDGTSITDAALERKLVAAVKRDPSTKVWIAHATKLADRAAAIRALVKRAGVTNVEVSAAIETKLPDRGPPPVDNSPTIVLTVDAKGALFIGSAAVADAQLDKKLAELAKTTNKLAIAADASTPYSTIVKIMDRCRAAGLTEISFAAK